MTKEHPQRKSLPAISMAPARRNRNMLTGVSAGVDSRRPACRNETSGGFLRSGKRPAWEIEEEMAKQFNVSVQERSLKHSNSGVPVWTNDVAFALKRLIEDRKIHKDGTRKAPNGGHRGIYYLSTL